MSVRRERVRVCGERVEASARRGERRRRRRGSIVGRQGCIEGIVVVVAVAGADLSCEVRKGESCRCCGSAGRWAGVQPGEDQEPQSFGALCTAWGEESSVGDGCRSSRARKRAPRSTSCFLDRGVDQQWELCEKTSRVPELQIENLEGSFGAWIGIEGSG